MLFFEKFKVRAFRKVYGLWGYFQPLKSYITLKFRWGTVSHLWTGVSCVFTSFLMIMALRRSNPSQFLMRQSNFITTNVMQWPFFAFQAPFWGILPIGSSKIVFEWSSPSILWAAKKLFVGVAGTKNVFWHFFMILPTRRNKRGQFWMLQCDDATPNVS